MNLYLLGALAGLSLLSTAAAAYYRLDAKHERSLKEVAEESNKTLRADLDAIASADSAVSARLAELNQTAAAATKALRDARKADATLDSCLSYDPGVDLTGGLRDNFPN